MYIKHDSVRCHFSRYVLENRAPLPNYKSATNLRDLSTGGSQRSVDHTYFVYTYSEAALTDFMQHQ